MNKSPTLLDRDWTGNRSSVRDLAAGGNLGGLLDHLATTTKAANALGVVYSAVPGRAASAADLASGQGQLANSYPLAGVRCILAASPAGIAAVQAVFQDAADRAPMAGELTGAEAATGTRGQPCRPARLLRRGRGQAASPIHERTEPRGHAGRAGRG